MKNKTYMSAIEAIAEVYYENEKLELNHAYLVNVHDNNAAEKVEKEICRNINKMMGMKEMLSILSGKDYEDVDYDVIRAAYLDWQ